MKPLSLREVERILRDWGFKKMTTSGSHVKWKNEETGCCCIVPFHGYSRIFPQGTLKSIFRQADIPEEVANDY